MFKPKRTIKTMGDAQKPKIPAPPIEDEGMPDDSMPPEMENTEEPVNNEGDTVSRMTEIADSLTPDEAKVLAGILAQKQMDAPEKPEYF